LLLIQHRLKALNILAWGIAPSIPQIISIKATTNEKLGYVGREEGVNAYAVALLVKE